MASSKASYDLLAAATASYREGKDGALADALDRFMEARGDLAAAVNEVLTQLMLARQPLELGVRLLEAVANMESAALDVVFTRGKLDQDP